MKIVVYGPQRRLGAVVEQRVIDLERAAARIDPEQAARTFASLLTLIETGVRGLDLTRVALDGAATDDPAVSLDLPSAQLHAPFPGRRFALAGGNNADHVANGRTNRGQPMTADEVRAKTRQSKAGGFWVVAPPVGPGSDVEIPRTADGLFDYEGEVAVVLGIGGKRLAADAWPSRVWGTVLVIDWSIRSQTAIANRQPFYGHKNFDGAKSIGPWIAIDEVDPAKLDVETRVNGELRQRFNTHEMIHSYWELLEQMSEDFTLLPGDVLSGGTGAGTAVDSTVAGPDGRLPLDRFLKDGDVVDVSAPELGTLSARVVGNV